MVQALRQKLKGSGTIKFPGNVTIFSGPPRPLLFWQTPLNRCRYLVLSMWYKFACQNSKLIRQKKNDTWRVNVTVLVLFTMFKTTNRRMIATTKQVYTQDYGSRHTGTHYDVFAGHGTCVPAKIITRFGLGMLMAELTGPGTVFRCVRSYFNPWLPMSISFRHILRCALFLSLTDVNHRAYCSTSNQWTLNTHCPGILILLKSHHDFENKQIWLP